MKIRYKDFLNEQTTEISEIDTIKKYVKKIGIKNYTIRKEYNRFSETEEFKVDVFENVMIKNTWKEIEFMYELPIKFGNIDGTFYLGDRQKYHNFTTLKGCPEKVKKTFECSNGIKLRSLEYCPKIVGGDFWFSNNNIVFNIENYPLSIINGDITYYDN